MKSILFMVLFLISLSSYAMEGKIMVTSAKWSSANHDPNRICIEQCKELGKGGQMSGTTASWSTVAGAITVDNCQCQSP